MQYSFHHFYLQYERSWVVLKRLLRLYNKSKQAASRGSYAYVQRELCIQRELRRQKTRRHTSIKAG